MLLLPHSSRCPGLGSERSFWTSPQASDKVDKNSDHSNQNYNTQDRYCAVGKAKKKGLQERKQRQTLREGFAA